MTDLKLITCIVQRDKADKAVDAAQNILKGERSEKNKILFRYLNI